MNRIVLRSACLLLMASALPISAFTAYPATTGSTSCTSCTVVPHLAYRSQSENAARELVGWTDHINLHDMQKQYGSFSITPEYTRSFKPYAINQSLFGSSLYDCKRIKITGSDIATRNAEKDWAAEYFYLTNKFDGEISFQPRIQNVLTDFNLYFGLDQWAHGLYTRIHAPAVWTKWDLHATENIHSDGIVDGASGFPDIFGTGMKDYLLTRFFDYSCNQMVPTAQWSTEGINYAQTAYPLTAAKICPCSKRKTGLSDIQADLGWNYSDQTYHIGFFARAVAPTGTRPTGDYLFEPIIGNGKHWELGGGITTHAIMWESQDTARTLGIYIDANLTHMFKSRQQRVFDLKDYGQLSRYMLLLNYTGDKSPLPALLTPAANLTRQTVDVSVGVHADVAAMITYASYNTTWDIGYNFWARSCEKITCPRTCACNPCNLGLALDGESWAPATQNGTIHTIESDDYPTTKLSVCDLDIDGARTKGLSHKIFTHIGYSWLDHGDWIPFLGLGVEGEFGGNAGLKNCAQTTTTTPACCCKNYCTTNCGEKKCACCSAASLSQWGVWIKGGVSF